MFVIAASRCAPRARAEGSWKSRPSVVAPPAAGAGDGVAGASVAVLDAGTGAAGGAGVCVVAGAGVDGAFVDDVAEVVADAALGCRSDQRYGDMEAMAQSLPLIPCRL